MKRTRWKWSLPIAGALIAFLLVVFFMITRDRMRKSHDAHCFFNQRMVTAAAGAYMNEHDLRPGDPLDRAEILRKAGMADLECWDGGVYTWGTTFPDFSKDLAPVSCSLKQHQPQSTAK